MFTAAQLVGCYYMQAVSGQIDVLRKRRPVAEVVADTSTDRALRERLLMVQDARQFAVDTLLLPENGSYRSYADVRRDYVLWNVFAAPEFSLTPKRWCYPVAGCVAYRGYFSQQKARKYALKLERRGFDVAVSGVPAYSTLGRFDDPILNTMLRWSDTYLVETLFHELAHQKLYVKGDSAFNESFATAVASFGIERWKRVRGIEDDAAAAAKAKSLRARIRDLVFETRRELEILYAGDLPEADMRATKKLTLDRLSQRAQDAIDQSGVEAENRLAAPLNNARLIPAGLYEGKLSAFQAILQDCEKNLACFYEKSAALAKLDFEPRQEQLARLQSRGTGGTTATSSQQSEEEPRGL